MKLFRNTLLFIVAVQIMVLIQVFYIKKWNTQPTLTAEEKKFFLSLATSIEAKLKKHQNHLFQNQFFTLGYGHINKAIKDDVELTAKNLLGIPYVWGATGPNTFDCSGFTQEVFSQAGIRIPRNSRAQAKVGKYINYENLRRGDMVFFDSNTKKRGYITHVGIYLSEGKFIHASSGKKRIIISSLIKSDYYKEHFVLGRRIIQGHKTKEIAKVL